MGERERILQLVRDGILSVDEGLDLLENVADKETKETARKEFTSEKTEGQEEVKSESSESEKEETAKEDLETEAEREEKASEFADELEGLANKINKYSVKIDEANEKITKLKEKTTVIQTEIEDRKEEIMEDYQLEKDDLTTEMINLNKEIELVQAVDQQDEEELERLNKNLTAVMEQLDQLEKREDPEIDKLEEKLEKLEEKRIEVTDKKDELLKDMHSLRMKQWTTKAKQVSEKIELPEGWREGTNKTIDKAGSLINETSKTLGDALRKTFQTTKETFENIDWKDIDLRFDADKNLLDEFEHEWTFEETTATILDFKNANGNIQFKTSQDDTIKVQANIKLYGKMDEATSLAAFEARSTIDLTEDKFTFHIPNKNIVANMIIYLPEREYDYIRSNSFNGNVKFDQITTRDIYVKTTNGDIVFDQLEGTMLEIKGTNGNITVKDAQLRDLLINTVNGDIRILGNVQSSDINTTNGTIRLTLNGKDLIRVMSASVNGDVKISLPKEIALEIEARTTFGKVKSRLAETKSIMQKELKGHTHRFERYSDEKICRVKASTTTGNILFKDTDEV